MEIKLCSKEVHLPNSFFGKVVSRNLQNAKFLSPSCLTVYLWSKGLNSDIPGFSCPVRHLTGLPCPSCFLTRSTSAALHADFSDSLKFHILGPLVAAGLIFWSLKSLTYRRIFPFALNGSLTFSFIAFLLIYWLTRLLYTYIFELDGFLRFPGA